jgi:hypothetical protein
VGNMDRFQAMAMFVRVVDAGSFSAARTPRRSAVEPVIGHLKAEHRMGRSYLWFRRGDAANAGLAVAGYNFRRLIRWLRLLRQILSALIAEPAIKPSLGCLAAGPMKKYLI